MLTHDVARAPAASRLAGCVALCGAVLSVAVHVWIRSGVFVPIRLPASVEYVWISATAAGFVAILGRRHTGGLERQRLEGQPVVSAGEQASLDDLSGQRRAADRVAGRVNRAGRRARGAAAAQQAALMVDELGDCTLCVASPYGRVNAKQIQAALETVDPIVAHRYRPGGSRDYDEWLSMPGQIRAWYIEATGHEPATTDLGRHLYQWREEHVPATEIRRRIFVAAGKSR